MARPIISQSVREGQLNSLPNIRFVRWVGAYENNVSKATMRCNEGHEWVASVNHLLDQRTGCPGCSKKRAISKITSDESERERQLQTLPNLHFVKWSDGKYLNRRSKADMQCRVCGHTWSTTVDRLVNTGVGCPLCANKRRSDKKKVCISEITAKLSSIRGMRLVNIVQGARKNAQGRATMLCDTCLRSWTTSVGTLLNGKSGCPFCAKYGFDRSKPGTLYALRSECGAHIKVGISNVVRRRIRQLQKTTPFSFNLVERFDSDDGGNIARLEKLFHSSFESSMLTGFDGATEWLRYNPSILQMMRDLDKARQ